MIYVQSEITEYESWPFDEWKVHDTGEELDSEGRECVLHDCKNAVNA